MWHTHIWMVRLLLRPVVVYDCYSDPVKRLGKVYRIDGDTAIFEEGDRGFLQIRLDSPHLLCKGDRCIVRRESPLKPWGWDNMDPYAPKIRQRNRSEQTKLLNEISAGHQTALLLRMGRQGRTTIQYGLLDCTDGIQLGSFGMLAPLKNFSNC